MDMIEMRVKLLELARGNTSPPADAEKIVQEAERLERFVLRSKGPDILDSERR